MIHVDVYRVGLSTAGWRVSRRYLAHQIRRRNWRAVRNHLKGIRAEHEGCAHNCGTAWFSERAAVRRAALLCERVSR